MDLKDVVLDEIPEVRPLNNNLFIVDANRYFKFMIRSVKKEQHKWMVAIQFQDAKNKRAIATLPIWKCGKRLFVSVNRGIPKNQVATIFVSVFLT